METVLRDALWLQEHWSTPNPSVARIEGFMLFFDRGNQSLNWRLLFFWHIPFHPLVSLPFDSPGAGTNGVVIALSRVTSRFGIPEVAGLTGREGVATSANSPFSFAFSWRSSSICLSNSVWPSHWQEGHNKLEQSTMTTPRKQLSDDFNIKLKLHERKLSTQLQVPHVLST